jgi:biotin carboxyl carrier protein
MTNWLRPSVIRSCYAAIYGARRERLSAQWPKTLGRRHQGQHWRHDKCSGATPPSRNRAEGEEMNEAKRTEIKVPKIAGASNLTIGRWFKRVGDPVSIGEPVVEIDTYNLTHELPAPATGILSSVMVKDGGSVEPGTVIGTIDQV